MEDRVYQFVPLDVRSAADSQIKLWLLEIAQEFPYSGGNYAEEILIEAAARVRKAGE